MGILAELFSMPAPERAGVDRLLPQGERVRYSRESHSTGMVQVERYRKGDRPRATEMRGKLAISHSGWLILEVPNGFIKGAFKALDERGTDLPYYSNGDLNGHISVMHKSEVEKIGADAIKEVGQTFSYQLSGVKSVDPESWDGVERCWFMEAKSADLEGLREKYGLSRLPHDGDYQFHITFAVKPKERAKYSKGNSERWIARYEKDWDESKHPRDGGKFAPKEGDGAGGDDSEVADDEGESEDTLTASSKAASTHEQKYLKAEGKARQKAEDRLEADQQTADEISGKTYKEFETDPAYDNDDDWEDKAQAEATRRTIEKLGYDPNDEDSVRAREFEEYKTRYIQYRAERAAIFAQHGEQDPEVAPKPEKYAKDARWITLNGGDGGGTPVQVDGSGKIVKGPSGLAKKGVKKLDDLGKKNCKNSPKKPKKEADDVRLFDELPEKEPDVRLFDDDHQTRLAAIKKEMAGLHPNSPRWRELADRERELKASTADPPAAKSPDDFRSERLASIKSEMAKLQPGSPNWRELADEERELKKSTADAPAPKSPSDFKAEKADTRLKRLAEIKSTLATMSPGNLKWSTLVDEQRALKAGFQSEDDRRRFEDAAKRHEDGVSQEAGFKDSADEKRFEQSLKPAGKSGWLKSLPRFQRQMVEELWEKHLEKNPKASRDDFEESLRGDSRKANQKPKPEKPARQPAKKPAKPKPKKDPQDNLWPYVGLDRTPEPEPTYTEMTEFEDDAPAPVSTGTSDDRRLGLKLGDLDKQLEDIAGDAQAEKARRKAAKQSLFQAFQTMVSGWMKPADDTDYGPGAMGAFRGLVAKSLHSKDAGEREKYQRQAFRRFLGECQRYVKDAAGHEHSSEDGKFVSSNGGESDASVKRQKLWERRVDADSAKKYWEINDAEHAKLIAEIEAEEAALGPEAKAVALEGVNPGPSELDTYFEGWVSSLSDEQREAISGYTEESTRINSALRGGMVQQKQEAMIRHIDDALSSAAIPEDMTVFRGLNRDPKWKVGGEVVDDAFMSTTSSRTIADDFATRDGKKGVTMEFVAPKGSSAAEVSSLSGSYGSEGEILFPRETKLRVVSKKGRHYVMEMVDE